MKAKPAVFIDRSRMRFYDHGVTLSLWPDVEARRRVQWKVNRIGIDDRGQMDIIIDTANNASREVRNRLRGARDVETDYVLRLRSDLGLSRVTSGKLRIKLLEELGAMQFVHVTFIARVNSSHVSEFSRGRDRLLYDGIVTGCPV